MDEYIDPAPRPPLAQSAGDVDDLIFPDHTDWCASER